MPTAQAILEQATRIANEQSWLAVLWHVAAWVSVLSLGGGWRPSRRTAALLVTLPIASAAILAGAYGNPVNAAGLAMAVALLAVIAFRLPREPIAPAPPWSVAAGLVVIGFALAYPHFVEVESVLGYIYSSPVGLLPCPSLALAIGFALLGGGFRSRLHASVLASFGLLYGIGGILGLGVLLDLGLAAGSIALLGAVFASRAREAAPGEGVHSYP
jgi:hypothetical protein